MKKQCSILIKSVLLSSIFIMSLVACYKPVNQEEKSTPSPSCRVIQHTFGNTCIPLNPQRIIALDPKHILDPLIALGINPIGFATYNGSGEEFLLGVSFSEVAGAEKVGEASQPSLEKILRLKPDLILTTNWDGNDQQYQLLSEIAPTISVPNDSHLSPEEYESTPQFKENLRYIAKVLDQEERAEEVLRQYQERIEALKNRLGSQLYQIEISVIFYGEGYIWTISKGNYPISHILDDIGLRYKSVPYGQWNLSVEAISEYDSDILFIVDVDRNGADFYLQHPIFQNLEVVKNNRTYVVSQESWRTAGISGANKTLDDLFKYLPEDQ